MTDNDIAKMIASTIGTEPSSQITSTPERAKQYDDILPESKNFRSNMNQELASKKAMKTYAKKLFKGNKWLKSIKNEFIFKNVKTIKESTKSIPINKSKNLIVLDSHTQKFVWMMNKATLYGEFHLSVEDNLKLYAELFLHFSSVILSDHKIVYQQPVTPKHNSKEELYLLAFYTEIQEVFLLAHEVAHVLIRKERYQGRFDLISQCRKNVVGSEFVNNDELLNEEILADEIAFEMTLNVYGRDNPDIVNLVSSAIFVLIRYFLWLRITYKKEDEDFEFGLWLSRNSFIREKISQIYKWGPPTFIISILESMEERMEPAAAIARNVLEKEYKY